MNQFEKGILYKHINNTDVAFEIKGGRYSTSEYQILKIRWWNVVNPNNIHLIGDDKVTIQNNKLTDWLQYAKIDGDNWKVEVTT